jgi:hypothetical protein
VATESPGGIQLSGNGSLAGVLLIGLGCTTLAIAVGLLQGRKWAWWGAVILFTINGAGDAVGLVMTRDFLRSGSGIVIAALFILALTRRAVRQSFQY